MNSKVYKWCAVHLCKNTSIATPNKLFVYVPNKKIVRDKWLKLAGRDPSSIVTNSPIYFCEDHFDLPNDMENYMQYHLMGTVSQVRMKPGCIPKNFSFQPDRKSRTPDTIERPYTIKKRKMMSHDECEKQLEEKYMVTKHFEVMLSGSSGPIDAARKRKSRIKHNPCTKMNSKVYKWCAVHLCKNTSIATPTKLFVYVPNKKIVRDKWLKLAGRDPSSIVTNSPLYFCEDHFDLPNDMENYMQYHLMGTVSQVRMKPGCIPKNFSFQPDRKSRTPDTIERPYTIKKRKMMSHDECEKQLEEKYMVTKHFEVMLSGSSESKVADQEVKKSDDDNGVSDNNDDYSESYNHDNESDNGEEILGV